MTGNAWGWIPIPVIAFPVGLLWGITAQYVLNVSTFWRRAGVAMSCYVFALLLVTIAVEVTR